MDPVTPTIQVVSLDPYVKAFIDQNWLTIAIFLYLIRGLAVNFGVKGLEKVYQVLSSTYSFIRPGAIRSDEDRNKPPNGK